MHEIVTLQFGQRANYLGTHYWNTQESYFTYDGQEESPVDHDVSFVPGTGADGSDTYTPRVLLYDLKGAFGTLRRENALYELQQNRQPHQQTPWAGESIRLELPPIAPSSYQQALETGAEPPVVTSDTVRFWSDYNHIFYHPRSLVQLNEYELNSQLMPFELWQTGEDLFNSLDREHDLLDRDLRPLLEQCDHLQAIQIFSSVDDAWGGFATKYLERIEDEHGKGCRWLFALEENDSSASRGRQMLQFANTARSTYAMNDSVTAYIPMSSAPRTQPQYLRLNTKSSWFVSALQATLVESVTLPTRLRSTQLAQASFNTLETILNNDGKRRVAAPAITVEDPKDVEIATSNSGQDTRMANGHTNGISNDHSKEDALDMDLFPSATSSSRGRQLGRRDKVFSKSETLRGAWLSEDEILESNIASRDRFSGTNVRLTQHQSQLLYPILSSFPSSLFDFTSKPKQVALRASLSTSSAVADRLRSLGEISRRLLGADEQEAVSDGLKTMAEEYEEGWLDFTDSEDEDE